MSFHKTRRIDLKIYFNDSPHPLEVKNCCHLGTEGGLLRVMTTDPDGTVETQWWPLCNVFNIRQIGEPRSEFRMSYQIERVDLHERDNRRIDGDLEVTGEIRAGKNIYGHVDFNEEAANDN